MYSSTLQKRNKKKEDFMSTKHIILVVVSLFIVSASAQQAANQPDTAKKQQSKSAIPSDTVKKQQAATVVQTNTGKQQSSLYDIIAVKENTFSGSVINIDTSVNTLRVKDVKGDTRTFKISSDTKMTAGEKSTLINLKEIKKDDNVTIIYPELTALSVHVSINKTSTPATPVKTGKVHMRGDTATTTGNAAIKP